MKGLHPNCPNCNHLFHRQLQRAREQSWPFRDRLPDRLRRLEYTGAAAGKRFRFLYVRRRS
jgi:hypothetical protein